MTTPPRTLLFIPASRPDFVLKAALRGADVVILDLEDGVAPQDKARARALVAEQVQQLVAQGQRTWVRIQHNGETGLDLMALAGAPVEAVMLPKTQHADEAAMHADLLSGPTRLVPLIESCEGLLQAAAIARAHPRVAALALGSEDLAAELGVIPDPVALSQAAQMLVIAARAAGLPALGLPGSLAEFRDLDQLAALGRLAAQMGLEGAMAVHPAQIAVLQQAFMPVAQQLNWARLVLQGAQDAHQGAFSVQGQMIDRPIIERARRVLQRAGLPVTQGLTA